MTDPSEPVLEWIRYTSADPHLLRDKGFGPVATSLADRGELQVLDAQVRPFVRLESPERPDRSLCFLQLTDGRVACLRRTRSGKDDNRDDVCEVLVGPPETLGVRHALALHQVDAWGTVAGRRELGLAPVRWNPLRAACGAAGDALSLQVRAHGAPLAILLDDLLQRRPWSAGAVPVDSAGVTDGLHPVLVLWGLLEILATVGLGDELSLSTAEDRYQPWWGGRPGFVVVAARSARGSSFVAPPSVRPWTAPARDNGAARLVQVYLDGGQAALNEKLAGITAPDRLGRLAVLANNLPPRPPGGGGPDEPGTRTAEPPVPTVADQASLPAAERGLSPEVVEAAAERRLTELSDDDLLLCVGSSVDLGLVLAEMRRRKESPADVPSLLRTLYRRQFFVRTLESRLPRGGAGQALRDVFRFVLGPDLADPRVARTVRELLLRSETGPVAAAALTQYLVMVGCTRDFLAVLGYRLLVERGFELPDWSDDLSAGEEVPVKPWYVPTAVWRVMTYRPVRAAAVMWLLGMVSAGFVIVGAAVFATT
ncbi:hypothetical protein Lfu02_41700 [Longispora fulva]|uniref:Uncharacterized protein n=1 Tax=Longispora fulva TaxID=619741 RepID=A0A8J7GDG4_9ACTN|nr:hypothetical protein [Longispora fulva]MBG6136629.1 hypothetical protein [Longispora fulva]GIG59798.1 hypothetical protein Lfu02_41700 [Longispora fulva]